MVEICRNVVKKPLKTRRVAYSYSGFLDRVVRELDVCLDNSDFSERIRVRKSSCDPINDIAIMANLALKSGIRSKVKDVKAKICWILEGQKTIEEKA